jgi:hypothetical protein
MGSSRFVFNRLRVLATTSSVIGRNTTDGSRWMVLVQPTKEATLIDAAGEARRRERLPYLFLVGFL